MNYSPTGRGSAIRDLLNWFVSRVSWRKIFLLYIFFNLKSIPFSWHARLFFHLFSNLRFRRHVYPNLEASAAGGSQSHVHPIFAPASVTSRAPLFETDYNLHGSNSTYFSDLDISRTALVTRIYTPGMELTKREMERVLGVNGKTKYPGRMAVMLGSVYCTFKKEILPYERYEMQSKVAGWDRKWLYILTFFLRPARRAKRGAGDSKTLLAVGVSKYVVKKGRLTVPPERILRASGLLPPNPDNGDQSGSSSALGSPGNGEGINAGEGLDGALVREALTMTEGTVGEQAVAEAREGSNSCMDWGEWTWERIEQERRRGLKAVASFIELDANLSDAASVI